MFGYKREELAGGCSELNNECFHDLQRSEMLLWS